MFIGEIKINKMLFSYIEKMPFQKNKCALSCKLPLIIIYELERTKDIKHINMQANVFSRTIIIIIINTILSNYVCLGL